jgi:hypothetical protein
MAVGVELMEGFVPLLDLLEVGNVELGAIWLEVVEECGGD